jgi:hypothetical protein
MSAPFLTARWSNLTLFSFAVPEALLEPRLPDGVELDRLDGQAVVSLVGLDFDDTRVMGVGWPGHRAFPDINFRFYVRAGERRGVTFVREIVPLRMVAWVARALYDEPFVSAPVTSRVTSDDGLLAVERRFTLAGREHRFGLRAEPEAFLPGPETAAHFLKERAWGFGRNPNGTQAFEVQHPPWAVHRVVDWTVDVDFGAVYGPEWAFLAEATPLSVVLASGSEVAVLRAAPLRR